jgi:Tfp pilus assembly protein PilZ
MNAVEETTFSFSREAPQPPERRRDRRHMTILRVGTLIVSDRRELCLIRNISAGGLMAHVYSQMKVGQPLQVELKTHQRVAGKVSWCSGTNIGITFDDQVDVEDLLACHSELENGWRPRLPRVEVDRLGMLRTGADIYAFNTRDISQGGLKIEIDEPMVVGDEVVITLEGFRPLPGSVRWYHDGLCGIAFHQVIPFQELIGWLRSG